MERNLKEALKHRRSYYAIDNQTTIPDAEIEEILDFAALHTPSAFNSQSTRMVLLLREQHRRLWDIVRNTLKKTIPAAAYASTEAKINKSFAAGYGTVLRLRCPAFRACGGSRRCSSKDCSSGTSSRSPAP